MQIQGLDCEDDILNSRECPGTFRWADDKTFPELPPFPSTYFRLQCGGWGPYLNWRGGNFLLKTARADPSLLDCLSSPVTLMLAMEMLNLDPGPRMIVIVLGSSRRAEERTARSTKVWFEISNRFPNVQIELYLVGPEMSDSYLMINDSYLKIRAFKGTFLSFTRAFPSAVADPSILLFLVCNGGFGNFVESNNFSLLWSWFPDLRELLNSGAHIVFTCANDYGDAKGEVAVMRLLGGNYGSTKHV